jgi:hypothetical protein
MSVVAFLRRPSTLAAIFGTYVLFVMLVSLSSAAGLSRPSYDAAISRWIYAAYLIASAGFLAGLAVLAFHIRAAFESRVREVNRELGGMLLGGGASFVSPDFLPPPPDQSGSGATDMPEILETLGEAQTHEVLLVPSSTAGPEAKALSTLQRSLLHRRDDLRRQQTYFTKLLPGPMTIAVAFVGIAAAMLPTSDVVFQTSHQLNTALITGFAYSWIGLAAYFAISVLGVIGAFRPGGKHKPRKAVVPQPRRGRVEPQPRGRTTRSGR